MGQVVILGLSDSTKVPGFYGETLFGQSPIRFGSANLKCLLVGLKADTGGDILLDNEARRIFNKEDADTAAGAGGEAARMCYAALDEAQGLDGFELYVACPTGAGGVAASVVATFTGTASAAGTIIVWPSGGDRVEVSIASGDVQNTVATKVDAAVKAATNYARFASSSGVSTNAVTWTCRSAGVRGNQHIAYVDFSDAPGVTCALSGTGGSATTSSSTVVGRKYGSGTLTETLTTLLANLFPMWHEFYGIAQNDATSLAAWEAQVDAKAAPTEGRTEHFVVASNANFAGATSLAQTTLNNQRFSLKWLEIGEQHPSETAAAVACLRAALEQSTPNRGYDDYAYKTIKPQRFPSDFVTSFAEKQAALDVGVAPLETRADGKVYEIRSITTRCLSGSTPDYRTLDTNQAFVPDRMRYRAQLLWAAFKQANSYVRSNPTTNEPDPPEGVAYPDLWNSVLYADMQAAEREKLITQVTLNPPSSEWNSVAGRIMTIMPVVPLPLQHQVGVSVRQLNAA